MTGPQPFRPLSLDRYFEPPEGWSAEFGWIIGYSADAAFLNLAAERFTGQTTGQRAHLGRLFLAVMLDPGHPQIPPADCPGVLHLLLSHETTRRPFRLLHAKVALLAFSSPEGDHRLRLIVSTGNWTRQSLESSLDLAWSVDWVSTAERDDGLNQLARCDIHAAWQLVTMIRRLFNEQAVNAKIPGSTQVQEQTPSIRAAMWLDGVSAPRGVTPRFIDNRFRPLLARVIERIPNDGRARNYIAMGSGFFESSGPSNAVPSVLQKLVKRLLDKKLLTNTAQKDVFCNPSACQAVAGSVHALSQNFWAVREAGRPDYFPSPHYELHAKFIFSASRTQLSNRCNSPWLYLGSGNLTVPGFTARMSPSGGNLEAGVIFDPGELFWLPSRRVPPDRVITNLLPIQHDSDLINTPVEIAPDSDRPEQGPDVSAGPISWLLWTPVDATSGSLLAPNDAHLDGIEVLDPSAKPCQRYDQGWSWPAAQPRQVIVRWSEGSVVVPVVDHYGRVAGAALRALDIDEAWSQLSNFPHPPELEDIDDTDGAGEAVDHPMPRPRVSPTANYPIRSVMLLIEQLSDIQTRIPRSDWSMWCNRLAFLLSQASSDANVAAFAELQFNPLSPLRHRPFRPAYAETTETIEGRMYENALNAVEHAWGVSDMPPLGGCP